MLSPAPLGIFTRMGCHVMLAAEECNLKNPAFVPAMLIVTNGRIKSSSR